MKHWQAPKATTVWGAKILERKVPREKFDFQGCFSLQGFCQFQRSSREAEKLSRNWRLKSWEVKWSFWWSHGPGDKKWNSELVQRRKPWQIFQDFNRPLGGLIPQEWEWTRNRLAPQSRAQIWVSLFPDEIKVIFLYSVRRENNAVLKELTFSRISNYFIYVI